MQNFFNGCVRHSNDPKEVQSAAEVVCYVYYEKHALGRGLTKMVSYLEL